MTVKRPEPGVHTQLARWVAEGLISSEQAARIETAEVARANAAGRPGTAPRDGDRSRGSMVVEALGYLGGAMAIIAGFIAVVQLWSDIPPSAEAGFAATAAVLLGATGAAVHTEGNPALQRLRSVLWLMSAASLAALGGVLSAHVWHLSASNGTLLSAAMATAYAMLLWLRTQAALQHLAVFAGAAVTLDAGIASIDRNAPGWVLGLAVWLLSVGWGAMAYRGRVRPLTAGYLATAVGLLVGAQLMMETAAGHVVALLTVGALLAGGVVIRGVWLLAIGAFGVIEVVPQTAARYLPNSLAAPLAVLSIGVVLLGVATLLAKRARASGRSGPPACV
ncbi:DUF2157 domain-containing protein [Streptomyces caeni]|uniref:DUF2157 domain-containing protein n=1 Tax=Streptomyces caeni TaxID=2307231 RepID=A0ABW4IY82_9ACTN